MRTAAIVIVLVLVGFGVFNNVNALTNGARPPESWLVDMVPTKVGDFQLEANGTGSKCSYRMNDSTYKELDPIGIVAQGIGCIRTNVCEKCQPSIHRDREFTFTNTGTDRFGYKLFH